MNIKTERSFFLSTSEVKNIKRLFEEGHSKANIARLTKRTVSTIMKIVDPAQAVKQREAVIRRNAKRKADPENIKKSVEATRVWRIKRRAVMHAIACEEVRRVTGAVALSDKMIAQIIEVYQRSVKDQRENYLIKKEVQP